MDNNNGDVNVISDTFEWIFEKFSVNDCKEEHLLSPKFTIEVNKKVFKWQLKWYPRGLKYKDYMALYLVSLNNFDVEAEFTLYFIDNKNKELLHKLSRKKIFRQNTGLGYGDFMKISSMKKLKNFSIICNIRMNTELANIINYNPESERMSKELDSLEKLMENDEFSDVSLTVGGQIFAAHKCLLANKSPVFAAMFRHSMKEKESNAVIIEDIEPAVFKEVLRFIYVGKVDEIQCMAIHLYKAADKYSLESLKDLCIVFLYDTISDINAVDYLEFADLYSLDELRKRVLDFIVEDPKKITDSPKFIQMGIRKPKLSLEILHALALEMETLKNNK